MENVSEGSRIEFFPHRFIERDSHPFRNRDVIQEISGGVFRSVGLSGVRVAAFRLQLLTQDAFRRRKRGERRKHAFLSIPKSGAALAVGLLIRPGP